MNILDTISSPRDLRNLDDAQTEILCQQIREFLVEKVSQTGGHLASNLGIVELTVAIHRVFDTSTDRLVFDVGHQSYVHKILTGRKDRFDTLRQYGGLAGFPKPRESIHDAFIAGHASSSVSIALGMARARTLLGKDYSVIAMLGDGALTGGLAYEGLSNAGASGEPLIVILNDNGMSITPNVGGMARHLSNIRTKQSYFRLKKTWRDVTQGTALGTLCHDQVHKLKEGLKRHLIGSNTFNDMGFEYIGPIDGHDIGKLTFFLRQAKAMHGPVLVHVLTQKGRGYAPAEKDPDLFHGVGKFDPRTGAVPPSVEESFSDTFGRTMLELAAENPQLCAITAAMQNGTGLDAFAARYPERFFDVGIAEGHAVCMAAGLAKQGMVPVAAIYSTFLQRAFDMLIHDVSLLNLHVVFAVDRAGLVGNDGETHHGTYDVGYLRLVPGMQILCPANQAELRVLLRRAVTEMSGPVAVRYPRGGDGRLKTPVFSGVLREGSDITLCAYGTMINHLLDAAELLAARGLSAEVVKLSCIKPLDRDWLSSAQKTRCLLFAEECEGSGAVYNEIAQTLCACPGIRSLGLNLGDRILPHGDMQHLYAQAGLDAAGIAARAAAFVRQGKEETGETETAVGYPAQ